MVDQPQTVAADSVVEVVAKAIEKASVDQLKSALSEIPVDLSGLLPFYNGLRKETDRACGIISFTFVESLLDTLWKLHLNSQITGGVDAIVGQNGILDTASAKIRMAAGLFWIHPATYKNLELFRKIRNEFAHRPTAVGFDDHVIVGLLSSMHKSENSIIALSTESVDLKPRQIFMLRFANTVAHLTFEMIAIPVAIRRGLPPTIIRDLPWDELPKNLREIYRASASVSLKILGKKFKIKQEEKNLTKT